MRTLQSRNEQTASCKELMGWISLVISNFGFVLIFFGLHPLLPFAAKPSVEPWVCIVAVAVWPATVLFSVWLIGQGRFPGDRAASGD